MVTVLRESAHSSAIKVPALAGVWNENGSRSRRLNSLLTQIAIERCTFVSQADVVQTDG